ncbi:MAG: hypothetical protein ACFFG0_44040 [Candidatus Thorarchaeota archaeon]
MDTSPLFFIIPTPINLTMIGEYINSTGWYLNYSIDGNELTLHSTLGFVFESKFNSDGFLTWIVMKMTGINLIEMVLGGGGEEAVPFGYYFLIFTAIGAIVLIYLDKGKIK